MDRRVTDLWNRIMSCRDTHEPVPIIDWREETLALHETITDEESRIGLMRIYNLICDLMAAHLNEEGGDIAGLELDRKTQIWKFLRTESLMDTGVPHPPTLLHVTTREIVAGRMAEDDEMHRYALALMTKWEEFLAKSNPEEAKRRALH